MFDKTKLKWMMTWMSLRSMMARMMQTAQGRRKETVEVMAP